MSDTKTVFGLSEPGGVGSRVVITDLRFGPEIAGVVGIITEVHLDDCVMIQLDEPVSGYYAFHAGPGQFVVSPYQNETLAAVNNHD